MFWIDKLDIFFEAVEMFWKGKEQEVECSVITEKVLDQFKNYTNVKREINAKTNTKNIS